MVRDRKIRKIQSCRDTSYFLCRLMDRAWEWPPGAEVLYQHVGKKGGGPQTYSCKEMSPVRNLRVLCNRSLPSQASKWGHREPVPWFQLWETLSGGPSWNVSASWHTETARWYSVLNHCVCGDVLRSKRKWIQPGTSLALHLEYSIT